MTGLVLLLALSSATAGSAITATAPRDTIVPAPLPKPHLGAAHATPAVLHAGQNATISFPITTSGGFGGPALLGAHVLANVTLHGRPLAHTTRLREANETVTLTLPKTSKDSRLTVTAFVALNGLTSVRD